jgi:hypothetical protein
MVGPMPMHKGPETPLEKVRRDLEYALRMLSSSSGYMYQPEEWMLLATMVGEADLMLRATPYQEAEPLRLLFEQVMTEFYDVTQGFTRLDYLHGSRAARRRNPELLNPR